MNFDECSENINHKSILIQDKKGKSKFYLENKSQLMITKIIVDGCLNITGKKCDYLITIDHPLIEIYIELKGRRVDEAIKQIENTIQQVSKNKYTGTKFCYIVHTKCLLTTQEIQNYTKTFKKNYNATLRFKPSGFKEKIVDIIGKSRI
ncbi:hypothetical protein [Aphanothece sacrum]|uniref:Two-component sensor histidine kinase n=1 Tax=Aphanothece sacrum FPU1 TaxID=1920663 RepID=A0A401IK60_APHSA|nr:hypothetical protein [Aphanothece sacrum]GBF81501.1 two-component sensor histidine kinase [Aphanothece sacrum FPU1]